MTPATSLLVPAFAVICVCFGYWDIRYRRVPRAPLAVSCAVLLALAILGMHLARDATRMIPAVLGAALAFLMMLGLALLREGAIGGGDITFMLPVGFVTGSVGWQAFAMSLVSMWCFAALAIPVILLARRYHRAKSARRSAAAGLPFIPCASAGAWTGILWGETLMHQVTRA